MAHNQKYNRPLSTPTLALAVAVIASGILSAAHIWGANLPGCGAGGGCASIITGDWGYILGWPLAFIGLAYFVGLGGLWLTVRQPGHVAAIRLLALPGAVVSVGLLALMFISGQICTWCVIAHIGNLGFVALLWIGRDKRLPVVMPPAMRWAVSISLALAVLFGARSLELREQLRAAEARHQEALESMAAVDNQQQPVSGASEQPAVSLDDRFGGRYWRGAVNADVRIVMFHDYRCELCHEAEAQVRDLLQKRIDVAFSVLHWPFDSTCNEHLPTSSPHPGACLAARAAEAAGIVGGPGSFWKMHDWLLQQLDPPTEEQVTRQAISLGIDGPAFRESLYSAEVDSLIAADIAAGINYGLTFTPMIFVNGYRLRGWQSAGALPAMITRVAQAAKQQPRAADRPDPAAVLDFQRWSHSPAQNVLPPDDRPSLIGQQGAQHTIVMFGDLTGPYNKAGWRILQRDLAGRTDARLVYRYFPLDGDCNPQVKQEINPLACEAARAAEATYLIGGEAAYQKAVAWLIDNYENFNPNSPNTLAKAAGVDANDLAQTANDARVSATVTTDTRDAQSLGITSSPTIFVDGRKVPNWRTPGIVERILDADAISRQ